MAEAKISIFDSAVTLGDTVTESTRTFAHQPFKLDRHIERLYLSLKVTRIDPGCDPEEMKRITLDLRGWAPYYEAGCHAVTAMSRMPSSQAVDARVKNRSRMAYTLAEMEVKLVDKDAQGIILDIYGNVAENKGGNIFVVSGGELRTPTAQNCLAGISRETILELAGQLGIPAREMQLQPYDLYTADELFFTSTPYCIMPATRFNGVEVGDGKVGAVTRKLLGSWSELVGVDIAKQAQAQMG
jgi:branched-chain amino acid aminotransferase